jgi:hypothetical protein
MTMLRPRRAPAAASCPCRACGRGDDERPGWKQRVSPEVLAAHEAATARELAWWEAAVWRPERADLAAAYRSQALPKVSTRLADAIQRALAAVAHGPVLPAGRRTAGELSRRLPSRPVVAGTVARAGGHRHAPVMERAPGAGGLARTVPRGTRSLRLSAGLAFDVGIRSGEAVDPRTIEPQGSPSVRGRQARIRTAAAESLSLADRVQVTREAGRIRVTLTRRHPRLFYLGDDEAQYLAGLLTKQLAPVTVSRIEDRPAPEPRLSLACRARAHGDCLISWCSCECHGAMA